MLPSPKKPYLETSLLTKVLKCQWYLLLFSQKVEYHRTLIGFEINWPLDLISHWKKLAYESSLMSMIPFVVFTKSWANWLVQYTEIGWKSFWIRIWIKNVLISSKIGKQNQMRLKIVLTQFSKNKFSYLYDWKYVDLLFGIYPGFFSLAPILGAPKRHNSSGFKTLLSEQLTIEFFKVINIRFALIL